MSIKSRVCSYLKNNYSALKDNIPYYKEDELEWFLIKACVVLLSLFRCPRNNNRTWKDEFRKINILHSKRKQQSALKK